jgi:8-oxo-dGTP diphosphatase
MVKGIDYPGLAVVYFCHDGQGRVVMGLRNGNARDENNRWDIGGGAVDLGDIIKDTLRKEIKEEYCTDVLDYKFLGYRDVHRQHNGRKTHWITLDFSVLIDPTQVAVGEPHKFDDVQLFTRENFPSNLHSQLPFFLEKYKSVLP